MTLFVGRAVLRKPGTTFSGGCPFSERNGIGFCGFFFSEHRRAPGQWKQTADNNPKSTWRPNLQRLIISRASLTSDVSSS